LLSFAGILLANELLDAMPVHQVVMREDGLREIYIEYHDRQLRLREGALSTPRIAEHLPALGVNLEPGWRADISLAAIDWMREAARKLKRGFMMAIDYGHEAAELYSVTHSAGTLTSFAHHRSAGPESAAALSAKVQQLKNTKQLHIPDKRFKQDPATSTVTFAKTFGWAAQVLGIFMPELYIRNDIPGTLVAVPAIPLSAQPVAHHSDRKSNNADVDGHWLNSEAFSR
jgi:hypothetical protein